MALPFKSVKFIEEVKSRPGLYLWDPPTVRAEKVDLWKEVGAALFPDWESCSKATIYDRVLQMKKKWRSLRDAYKRELRVRRRYNGTAHRKGYRYFKRMTFLGGFDGDVSPAGPESEEDEDQEKLLYASSEIEYQHDSTLADEDSNPPTAKKVKRKKRKHTSSESPQEEYEMPMPMFSSEIQDDDTDKFFLLSFLPEMRQLPVNIKMWARSQIANVMQEAVNCHYNNTTPQNTAETSPSVKMQNKDNEEYLCFVIFGVFVIWVCIFTS